MAFVSNMNDEEQKADPNTVSSGPIAPTGGGGGAVHLAPSSAVATVGGGGTAGPGKTPSNAGGSFASLDKYLSANQGQAAPLAGIITSGIGNQYNNLDTQNNATIANLNSQVTNAPGYTASDPKTLAAEAANPVSFAGDPNNVKQFQSLLKNTYSGPASAESTSGYTDQQTAINNAIAAGTAATGTEAGRENQLVQNEAKPTTGVTALNSAILSQDPNALSSVQNAYQPFNNLITNLSTGAQGVDTTIGKEQADASASSAAANKAIADQVAGLNTNVGNELTAAQKKYQDYQTQVANLGSTFQNGNLAGITSADPALNQFIGSYVNPWMTANAPGQTLSYNFANAIPDIPTVAAPTMNNAVTPQDIALYQALNGLSGMPQASPLQGITAASPWAAPALPSANNNAIAGDIGSSLGSVTGNLAISPYHQYLNLLEALKVYQGTPTTNYQWDVNGPNGPVMTGYHPVIGSGGSGNNNNPIPRPQGI